MQHSVFLASLALFGVACSDSQPMNAPAVGAVDAAAGDEAIPTEGTLFGVKVSSYVRLEDGVVATVGIVVPLTAIMNSPANAPFQDDVILAMPREAREQTMLSHLRINWLAGGHGPTPYGDPHFDLHFYRGSTVEIDAIDCSDRRPFPEAILSADHAEPSTCVSSMGFHAWPKQDLTGTGFSASLILGYYYQRVVFIEPMITKSTLLSKVDFELEVSRPRRSGGGATLYPARMRAIYDTASESYRFEFDRFEPID